MLRQKYIENQPHYFFPNKHVELLLYVMISGCNNDVQHTLSQKIREKQSREREAISTHEGRNVFCPGSKPDSILFDDRTFAQNLEDILLDFVCWIPTVFIGATDVIRIRSVVTHQHWIVRNKDYRNSCPFL